MQVLPSTAETPTSDKKPTMPNKTHAHRIFGWKVYKKIVLTIGSLTLTLPSPFGLR